MTGNKGESFISIKKTVDITFYALKKNTELDGDKKVPPVKNRYIFSNSFLLQQDLGICSIPGLNEDDAYNEWTLISKPKNVRRPSDLCLERVKENFKKLVSRENPDASYYPYFIYKPDIEMILKYFKETKELNGKFEKKLGI